MSVISPAKYINQITHGWCTVTISHVWNTSFTFTRYWRRLHPSALNCKEHDQSISASTLKNDQYLNSLYNFNTILNKEVLSPELFSFILWKPQDFSKNLVQNERVFFYKHDAWIYLKSGPSSLFPLCYPLGVITTQYFVTQNLWPSTGKRTLTLFRLSCKTVYYPFISV